MESIAVAHLMRGDNILKRLMRNHIFVLLATMLNLLLSVGCRTSHVEVPVGTYSDPTSGSYVHIKDRRVQVHIARDKGRTQIDDKECQYDLWPNGRIQLIFYRSIDYAHGVGRMLFFWDGNAIQMVDLEMGQTNLLRKLPWEHQE